MVFYALGGMLDPVRWIAAAIIAFTCKDIKQAAIGIASAVSLLELGRFLLARSNGYSFGVIDFVGGALSTIVLGVIGYWVGQLVRKRQGAKNG